MLMTGLSEHPSFYLATKTVTQFYRHKRQHALFIQTSAGFADVTQVGRCLWLCLPPVAAVVKDGPVVCNSIS